MTGGPMQALPSTKRYRLVAAGLLRAAGVAVVLVAAYYLLPLDHLTSVPLGVSLAVGLLVFAGVTAYEARAIIRARHPGARAVQALATAVPLFLILFAATYFLLAQDNATNFNAHVLSRTDALYFTVTVFATVGFGDITATSQTARVIVIVQMILDLIVLGFVVRVFFGAVERGREQPDTNQ